MCVRPRIGFSGFSSFRSDGTEEREREGAKLQMEEEREREGSL